MPDLPPPPPAGASDELRASEARYRSLVLASSAIVWGMPADGRFASPQPGWTAYTGQSYEELRGSGWINAVHPDDRAVTQTLLRHACEHHTMYVCEHRLRGKDGLYRVEPDNDRFTIRHDWTASGAASTVGVYSLDLFGARAAGDMRSGKTLTIRDVD